MKVEGLTDSDPERARAPDHPPEALHETAFCEVQERIAIPPCVIDEGLTDKKIVGVCSG